MSFRGRGSHTNWYSMRARGNPDSRYTPYPSRQSFYSEQQQQQLGQFSQDSPALQIGPAQHEQPQSEQEMLQQQQRLNYQHQTNYWNPGQANNGFSTASNGFPAANNGYTAALQSPGQGEIYSSAEMYNNQKSWGQHGNWEEQQYQAQQRGHHGNGEEQQHQAQQREHYHRHRSSHHHEERRSHSHSSQNSAHHSQRHSQHRSHEKSSSRSKSSSKMTCFYCELRFKPDEHENHRLSAHWELEFHCGLCPPPPVRPKHFAHFKDALKHLETAHQIVDSAELDAEEINSRGLLRLPVDLRSLKCRLCVDKHILAQDRVSLSAHVQHSHGLDLVKHVIRYDCRICKKDFGSGLEFSKHPCCQVDQSTEPLSKDATMTNVEGSAGGGDALAADNGQVCFFCDKIVPKESKASHKGHHWYQEFQCANSTCIKSFSFYEDFLRHATEAHQVDLTDYADSEGYEPGFVSGKIMSDNRLVILPKDLRCLECPYCALSNEEIKMIKKFFLGQDRASLMSHIKHFHPGCEIDKSTVTYSCRSCKKSGFASSENFLEHPCCKGEKQKIAMQQQQLQDASQDEKLVTAKDIEWRDVADADLRRLACLICSEQFNGSKFRLIIEHMESVHRKFQVSRSINLEPFVAFGCGNCKDFQNFCGSVRKWDHHFVSEDFKVCAKMALSVRKQAQQIDKEINSNDIRRLTCKLCNFESNHLPYMSMVTHIRSTHPTETETFAVLDTFVIFGCAKCPDPVAKNNSQWSSHFYKCQTRCRTSYQREQQQKQQGEQCVENQVDLRKLECKSCHFVALATGFIDFIKHMAETHDLTPSPNNNLEEKVIYGCTNCPSFLPETLNKWDRHFSQDFLTCQGSGKVTWSDKKVLYWCDVCSETRENIDVHFTNESHKTNLEKLVKEKTVQIFRCDVCDVAVSTEANYNLHIKGDYHSKALQRTMPNL